MEFNYKYGGKSGVDSSASATNMSFAPDTLREPTFFVGKINKHVAFREAISALNAVVVSDLRFKPKDKTAYLAWAKEQEELWLAQYIGAKVNLAELNARVETLNKEMGEINKKIEGSMGSWNKAKRSYFDYLYKTNIDAWIVLDPVITVHPDAVFFECFSKDESTYGKLSCSYNVFKNISEFECGTTNIDYSAALYNEFQKIRDYKETELKVDPSGFEVQTGKDDVYKEVKIDLPDTWVRGFLQVSSAMTLPAARFDLHPMDMHTLLTQLRRFKEKEGPRSLRFVLRAGQPVKVIVEPWGTEFVFARSPYTGTEDKEIRIWGRRRLLTLERLIPIAKTFRVSLLGSGLPSFFEADLGDMSYTLGLSGWTANDWSRAGNFDLLAPRMQVDAVTQKYVFSELKKNWFETSESLAKRLDLSNAVVSGALAAYTQAGRVIYDSFNGVYRVRELSREPLDVQKLRFSSPIEEKAARISDAGDVEGMRVEALAGGRVRLEARVKDRNRTHHTSLTLDADERIVEAVCDCSNFQVNKLTKGPCEHILALRMAFSKQQFGR